MWIKVHPHHLNSVRHVSIDNPSECVVIHTNNVPCSNESVVNDPLNGSIHCSSRLNCLSASKLTLPLFHQSLKQKLMQHIFALEEYFLLDSVPKSLQLVTALRSIKDSIPKSQFVIISSTLAIYKDIKMCFIQQFRSQEEQNRVKSSIYQDKV